MVVQRTTGSEIKSWVNNQFTPAHDRLVAALAPLMAQKGAKPLREVGLAEKLAAVTQQLNGHVDEVAYGAGKMALARPGEVAFGVYESGVARYGADVTALRRSGAGTAEKAVQHKVVSTPDPNNVTAAIVGAAVQLAGGTQSGELPDPAAQRVIFVLVRNPNNPYPWGSASDGNFAAHSRAAIAERLDERLKRIALEASFDKIKLEYDPPRMTLDGPVGTVTISRLDGARGEDDLREDPERLLNGEQIHEKKKRKRT